MKNSEKARQADVLIVDDTPMHLRLLERMLVAQGYTVRPAASGKQALEAVDAALPDIILLDVMMPGMDGYEVAARLKADERTCDIPIIFISNRSDIESKVRAFAAGGVDYTTKPIQDEEITARIETHLQLRNLTRQLQAELRQRESLIARLDETNTQLQREITERQAAEQAREDSMALLRAALTRTEILYRITTSIIAAEDLAEMLQNITDLIAQMLPADRVLLVTLDLEKGRVVTFVKGGPGAAETEASSFEELMAGLTGWVVGKVQPVLSPKGSPDPRESPAMRERRIADNGGSIVVVPLYYQGQILGTLTAINRLDQPDFTRQHQMTLASIASQVSVGLANAQLAAQTAGLKEFNESIVQGVAEALVITDTQQRITFANPAAATLLGYQVEELVGKPASAIIPLKERDHIQDQNVRRAQGVTGRYETALFSKRGRWIPVLASSRPLYRQGEFSGSLTAFTDVTGLKQAEAALRQYAANLEAQNAELDAFAHTVAHDLKSPLTNILGFGQLLDRKLGELSQKDIGLQLQRIMQNGRKMNSIIEELLLLSSVRESEIPQRSVLNMAQIVAEAQSRLVYLIEECQASVTVPEHWPRAVGYAPWIEEVWMNYISNAIKYGGDPAQGAPPRVELGYTMGDRESANQQISRSADQQSGQSQNVDRRANITNQASRVAGHPSRLTPPAHPAQNLQSSITFWVRDNGPGLTPEQQAQLFTPFERLHDARVEGHGLGLSIVRRIVEKLEGEVGVQSAPGQGSTFYFTLPSEAAFYPADVTPIPPTRTPDATRVSRPSQKTAPPMTIEGVPPALLARLRRATIEGDLQAILAGIAQIEGHNVDLAQALRRLAENFEHDAILEMIR